MTRLLPALLCVQLLLALPACISDWQYRPERARPGFEPGKTTKAEVVRTLGTPQTVRLRPRGTVLTWKVRTVDGAQLGLGSLLANFACGDTQAVNQHFDALFDEHGTLVAMRLSGPAVEAPGPWPFGDRTSEGLPVEATASGG